MRKLIRVLRWVFVLLVKIFSSCGLSSLMLFCVLVVVCGVLVNGGVWMLLFRFDGCFVLVFGGILLLFGVGGFGSGLFLVRVCVVVVSRLILLCWCWVLVVNFLISFGNRVMIWFIICCIGLLVVML